MTWCYLLNYMQLLINFTYVFLFIFIRSIEPPSIFCMALAIIGYMLYEKFFQLLVAALSKLLIMSRHKFVPLHFFFSVHGNNHQQPKSAISLEVLQYVVDFLFNYAEQHAVLFPGRVPGYKEMKLKLLPSTTNKKSCVESV